MPVNSQIDVYKGVPKSEIEAERQTSEGKTYTLDHPQELIVNMRYKGKDSPSANSQGWERSSTYYFKEVQSNHPDVFSKKNTMRIQNGESPRVDAKFVKAFPQYKGFENETLIHHHVGKDGQAVAVPQSIHKGSGEIHLYENSLGITDNGKAFSEQCKKTCESNPHMINETSDQFKSAQSKSQNSTTDRKNAFARSAGNTHAVSTTSTKTNAISKATHSSTNSSSQKNSSQSRSK